MAHLKIKTSSDFVKYLCQKKGDIFRRTELQYNRNLHHRYFSKLSTQAEICDQGFIIKSSFPHIEAVTGVTIPEFVWKDLHLKENKPALECAETGKILTHGDVYNQSRSFAAALIRSGLKRKDIVSVVLPNVPEFATVVFGVWESGATVSPANPSYTEDEIIRQITISEAKVVVTTPQFLPAIRSAKKSCPLLKSIIVIGSPQTGCDSFEDMITENSSGVDFLKGSLINSKTEVAVLPFSSGTTGPPKGVELTHSNITSNVTQKTTPDAILSRRTDGKQERLFGILPFFHSFGLTANLLLNQYLGTYMLCIPKFQPDTFVKSLKYFKPTTLTLVPPLVSFLATTPDLTAKDFDSVERLQVGAAPLGMALIDKFLKKADKFIFFQEMYGLTELSPGALTMNRSKGNSKLGSCGTLLPGTCAKVIDVNSGKSLGPDIRGEICIKGPQLMKGYFRNPEATANVIDPEGWFHTGDIGYYDSDGCFYIVDRLKELIKVKGLQVAPAELEDELRKHPEVIDVAVIGIPNERSGELPRAYIVRMSEDLTESKINDYMSTKVAKYKQLKGGVEFVSVIPKAPSGKILRRELKANYLAKTETK